MRKEKGLPRIHPPGTRNPFKNSLKGVEIFINGEPCLKMEKESTSSDCCMVKNSTTESNYPSKETASVHFTYYWTFLVV